MNVNVLIVEDDEPISNLIKLNLNMVGYECTQVFNGSDVFPLIKKKSFDLIILDIMLPGEDGFSLIKKISPLNIPVIFLTAKNTINDKVLALKSGGDDYIVKPFESIELIARIEAVLRRYSKNSTYLTIKDIIIQEKERVVIKNNTPINLTLKEFELLLMLTKNKNIALSRDYLLEKIWGYEYIGETRTVDTHIQKIRSKLDLFDILKTVYKIGYRLED